MNVVWMGERQGLIFNWLFIDWYFVVLYLKQAADDLLKIGKVSHIYRPFNLEINERMVQRLVKLKLANYLVPIESEADDNRTKIK